MLRSDRAVPDGPELIHVDGRALFALFDDALAGVVVNEARRPPVVADGLDAVFLVPDDVAPLAAVGGFPALLVAIRVVEKVPIADFTRRVRMRARVVVTEVVGGLVLHDGVGVWSDHDVALILALYVVDTVVLHAEGVFAPLIRRELPVARSGRQSIEAVVAEGLVCGAAELVRAGNVDEVIEGLDVADAIVVVLELLEGAGVERIESPVERVVAVLGDDAVTGVHEDALLEFVVFEAGEVGVGDAELFAGGLSGEAAGVVAVGQDLAVGVGHVLEAAPGVVDVLGGVDLGGVFAVAFGVAVDGFYFFDDFAEATVEAFFGAGVVSDAEDAADAA